MSSDLASFINRYGEEQVIHKTRNGLRVKRGASTPILALNQTVSGLFGSRVRRIREQHGWTLVDLALRVGIHSGHPKNRMWEIENSVRKEGVRLGTLYALAIALGVEAGDLLPPVSDVIAEAKRRDLPLPELPS